MLPPVSTVAGMDWRMRLRIWADFFKVLPEVFRNGLPDDETSEPAPPARRERTPHDRSPR